MLSKEQVRDVRNELNAIKQVHCGCHWYCARLLLQKGRPLVEAAVLSCSNTRGPSPPGAARWYST